MPRAAHRSLARSLARERVPLSTARCNETHIVSRSYERCVAMLFISVRVYRLNDDFRPEDPRCVALQIARSLLAERTLYTPREEVGKREKYAGQVIAIPVQRSLLSAHSSWQLTAAIMIFVRPRNAQARANTIMGGVLPWRGATKIVMERLACNYDLLRSFEWLYNVRRRGKRCAYGGNTMVSSVYSRCRFVRFLSLHRTQTTKVCITSL